MQKRASQNDKSLGVELKRRRLALEWTQTDTAKHFGVIKDTYQNWEWNHITPDIKRRKVIVEFLEFNYWDDESNSLANRVLLFRIENELYRIELGKLIGVSDSTIERVEKRHPHISSKIKVAIEQFILKFDAKKVF
ncbi:MAG: DNA-binding XRE family transcriptional regulator [Sediminicola sp.]